MFIQLLYLTNYLLVLFSLNNQSTVENLILNARFVYSICQRSKKYDPQHDLLSYLDLPGCEYSCSLTFLCMYMFMYLYFQMSLSNMLEHFRFFAKLGAFALCLVGELIQTIIGFIFPTSI